MFNIPETKSVEDVKELNQKQRLKKNRDEQQQSMANIQDHYDDMYDPNNVLNDVYGYIGAEIPFVEHRKKQQTPKLNLKNKCGTCRSFNMKYRYCTKWQSSVTASTISCQQYDSIINNYMPTT